MKRKNIYIRKEDEEIWERAEKMAGELGLSAFLAQALRHHVSMVMRAQDLITEAVNSTKTPEEAVAQLQDRAQDDWPLSTFLLRLGYEELKDFPDAYGKEPDPLEIGASEAVGFFLDDRIDDEEGEGEENDK